jgi:predicted MPP superfamily phosphohydrolase
MKRWIGGAALGAALAGAGVVWYASQVERADVQLDRFTVEIDRPGLPPEGVTILHLSDFHFRAGGRVQARKVARLRQLLAAERYDIVALTGDLVHDAAGFPAALALIESLRPRLGAFSCPGNHDYAEYSVWGVFGHTLREGELAAEARSPQNGDASLSDVIRGSLVDLYDVVRKLAAFVRKVLRNELVRLPVAFNDVPAMHAALVARGVQPLVNRAVHVQAEGLDLWIAGVDDLTEGGPNLAAALADVPDDAPLILLAHNPDMWLDRRIGAADLVLSGHTHGGQIRLPLVGVVHTQGTHLTRQRPAGWFERAGTRMFVSRGLGESIPLRFGVRPQAALIRVVFGQ